MPRFALDRWIYCALFVFVSAAGADEWTRFRGPNGSGVSDDTGFPTAFGKERNLVWRTPVRPGKSSPILTARRIFLTGFEDGKLFTQCFDRETGKLLWERSVDRPRAESANALNHPAAITAVTKSGTNELHGDAYFDRTESAWRAAPAGHCFAPAAHAGSTSTIPVSRTRKAASLRDFR